MAARIWPVGLELDTPALERRGAPLFNTIASQQGVTGLNLLIGLLF